MLLHFRSRLLELQCPLAACGCSSRRAALLLLILLLLLLLPLPWPLLLVLVLVLGYYTPQLLLEAAQKRYAVEA